MPGSQIDGRSYTIRNPAPVVDMPLSLIEWLLEPSLTKFKQTTTTQDKPQLSKTMLEGIASEPSSERDATKHNDYEFYNLTDQAIWSILNKLPSKYLDNYSDWLKVTTVLKHHDKFDIWDKWSAKSSHYKRERNMIAWNAVAAPLDINLLVWELRATGILVDFIPKYKRHEPITKNTSDIQTIRFNEPHVSDGFLFKHFKKHNTIIIKSCTGTGKTTAVAKHMAKLHDPNKLLTITTRTTLSDQHMKSFQTVKMKHYNHLQINPTDCDSLTICVNSLRRLGSLSNEELSDCILYIDEITSFLELTHNQTLDKQIVEVFNLVMRFVKHAGKVIVSDALITDSTFELLKHRNRDGFLFLENTYQKYKDVPAIRLRDENTFKDKLIDHCKRGDFFLFGCDSKKTVSTFYHDCKKACAEVGIMNENKFLLITDDYKEQIEDANELF
jgi:nucleoside-triphosphatase THEP1